jgi:RecA/RadA recombinase
VPINPELLEEDLKVLRKKYGADSFHRGSEQPEVRRLVLDSPALNRVTGGGIPLGRITRLWGMPGASKSHIGWEIVRAAQRLEMGCAYWNIEKQFDELHCRVHLGIDTKKLFIGQVNTIEDLTEEMELMMRSIQVHVVDSTSFATSREELAADVGDWFRALDARVWKKSIKRINARMDKDEHVIVLISHAGQDMQTKSEYAKDGGEVEFASSMSLHFRKGTWLYYHPDGRLDKAEKIKEDAGLSPSGQKEADGFEVTVRVNKCVSGDTWVHTINGLVRARDLDGEVLTLSEGGIYRSAVWSYEGEAELYRVLFSTGDEVLATPNHEWVTSLRHHGVRQRCLTVDLVGKSIPYQPIRDFAYDEEEYEEGVRHGMTFGDGTAQVSSARLDQFIPDDREVMDRFFSIPRPDAHFNSLTVPHEIKSSGAYRVGGLPLEWRSLPSLDEPQSYLRGFVAGLLEADGHVNRKGGIYIYCADEVVLEDVRLIAQAAGFSTGRITSSSMMTTGGHLAKRWGDPKYPREIKRTIYTLPLGKRSFFTTVGVIDDRLVLKRGHRFNLRVSGPPKMDLYARVVAVERADRVESVYCCSEPQTHTWVLGNGLLTGNSRVCRPFRVAKMRLDLHTFQFDTAFELLDAATFFDHDGEPSHRSKRPSIVQRTGERSSWFLLPTGKKVQGERKVREEITTDDELAATIRRAMLGGW